MADVKITALPVAGAIVANSDVLPLVTSGGATTSKATPAQITAAALTAVPATVAQGGTGAATAAEARTNLGLGSIAVQNSTNVGITGGAISLSALNFNSPSTPPTIDDRTQIIVNASGNVATITLKDLKTWLGL